MRLFFGISGSGVLRSFPGDAHALRHGEEVFQNERSELVGFFGDFLPFRPGAERPFSNSMSRIPAKTADVIGPFRKRGSQQTLIGKSANTRGQGEAVAGRFIRFLFFNHLEGSLEGAAAQHDRGVRRFPGRVGSGCLLHVIADFCRKVIRNIRVFRSGVYGDNAPGVCKDVAIRSTWISRPFSTYIALVTKNRTGRCVTGATFEKHCPGIGSDLVFPSELHADMFGLAVSAHPYEHRHA